MGTSNDDIALEMVSRVAPGTPLREAVDHIVAAGSGALIVIGDEERVDAICNGGFNINTPFTPQRLSELAKMDGAITLDRVCKCILKANVHLVLDHSLPTSETGMRHRTAERVAGQTGALVISVSQRRDFVSLYARGRKVVLEDTKVVLAKADQGLQTMQRFRARLDEATARLTRLELDDSVSVGEAMNVLQAQVVLLRLADEVARHVAELGHEGRLVRLQSAEIMVGVEEEHILTVRDYVTESEPDAASIALDALAGLSRDRVFEETELAAALGYPASQDVLAAHVQTRGYRLLSRIPLLPGPVAERLVEHFGSLNGVLEAPEQRLDDVEGVGARRAHAVREGLRQMRRETAH